MARNVNQQVVDDFGREWRQFDQSDLPAKELSESFEAYFAVFPWATLPKDAVGFDLGCGSGRWATLVAPRVGVLHCIDASEGALAVAERNLARHSNCRFHVASVDDIPLADGSMDFGYSLGVLHHVPDAEAGVRSCVAKLKRGAPLLLYLYYAFDNRPRWFVGIWRISDVLRRVVSTSPYFVKYSVSQIIALLVYFPLARLSDLLEGLGLNVRNIPLSSYRKKSVYTMRTDAFDRFGTRLEHRFTRTEVAQMMERAGLARIRVSEKPPYWCAVGLKA